MSTFRLAWELRYAGRVEEARALARAMAPFSAAERADLLLIEASFARHGKDLSESKRLLEEARRELMASGLEPSFQLRMQEAINLDVESKFAESMRLYQEARMLAADSFEQTLATVNLAIARYNLSLPFASLLENLGPLEHHPMAQTLEQLKLVSLKKSFAEGRPLEALALHFSPSSQGIYLQAWIESLPFVGASSSICRDRFRELALSSSSYFQKAYRLQTIEANPRLVDIDDASVPIQERADRIYLWVWRWLEDPSTFPVALLERELARFPFEVAHLSLTDEDFLLLRSAGDWLGLFDAPLASCFLSWRDKYFPKLRPAPFFDFEQSCVEAISRGDLTSLEDLAAGLELPAFITIARKVLKSRYVNQTVKTGTLQVRLSDSSIHSGASRFVSEPLAILLAHISRQSSLSFADALRLCFGIKRFDPIDHGPRVQNLLSRAKKLLPEGAFLRTKNQRIYLEGAAFVQVLEDSAHERNFPHFDWPELDRKQSIELEKKQHVDLKALLLCEFQSVPKIRKEFTRAELQARLQLSKATTNRLILNWTREGFLIAKGAGAARTYFLGPVENNRQQPG